jgi:hypothetical protein
MSFTRNVLVAGALLGTACTWQGSPVPVLGETASLEGEWEGTYVSQQTGRTGSILFRLKAGTDSAFGDVLMIPVRAEHINTPNVPQITEQQRALPRVLRISFVRCEVGRVAGRLDVYQDPETRERLFTTFEGWVRGDRLEGTFSTVTEGTGHLLSGEWSVKRTRH